MDDKNIQPVPFIYSQGAISFPGNEDTFRDLIVSLLGRPESIEGSIEGTFEISFGDVEYLNSLIDERISQQNQSALLQFQAKLFFHDDSSMMFNGMQEFLNYQELRPLTCEGFYFTWSYLVKFNNKTTFERQEISIYYNATRRKLKSPKSTLASKLISLINFDFSAEFPKIQYDIRCTDKRWGIEIAEIIKNGLAKVIKINDFLLPKLRLNATKNFNDLRYPFMILAYTIATVYLFAYQNLYIHECRDLSSQYQQTAEKELGFDEKIDLLIQLVLACNASYAIGSPLALTIFMACIFFLPFVLSFITYALIRLPNYSFLLFTEMSIKERDKYFRRQADRRAFWLLTVLAGLVIGVVGNYIFTWLTK